MKKKFNLFSTILLVGIGIGLMYYLFTPHHSEYDVVEKENPKMVKIFNDLINRLIEDNTQSNFYPGYNEKSHLSVQEFLASIESFETYSEDGIMSTIPRNQIRLNIKFKNGSEAKKLYTGISTSGYIGPSLLMKVKMDKGKAVQVFTNGVELKDSPEASVNDIYSVMKSLINYDKDKHPDKYFHPSITQEDIQKEWEDL